MEDIRVGKCSALVISSVVLVAAVIMFVVFCSKGNQHGDVSLMRDRYASSCNDAYRFLIQKFGKSVDQKKIDQMKVKSDYIINSMGRYLREHEKHSSDMSRKLAFAFGSRVKPRHLLDFGSVDSHFRELEDTLKEANKKVLCKSSKMMNSKICSFGEAALPELAERKSRIAQCPIGLSKCPYPLTTADREDARRADNYVMRGQGSVPMYNLEHLKQRHNEIGKWMLDTKQAIVVGPSSGMMSRYFALDGRAKKPSNRDLSKQDYTNTAMYTPHIFKEGSDAEFKYTARNLEDQYGMKPNYQQDYMRSDRGGFQSGPVPSDWTPSSYSAAGALDSADANLKPAGFGSSYGKPQKWRQISKVKNDQRLLKQACISGREGFAAPQPCMYPLYEEDFKPRKSFPPGTTKYTEMDQRGFRVPSNAASSSGARDVSKYGMKRPTGTGGMLTTETDDARKFGTRLVGS
jgi:hypothetical protein